MQYTDPSQPDFDWEHFEQQPAEWREQFLEQGNNRDYYFAFWDQREDAEADAMPLEALKDKIYAFPDVWVSRLARRLLGRRLSPEEQADFSLACELPDALQDRDHWYSYDVPKAEAEDIQKWISAYLRWQFVFNYLCEKPTDTMGAVDYESRSFLEMLLFTAPVLWYWEEYRFAEAAPILEAALGYWEQWRAEANFPLKAVPPIKKPKNTWTGGKRRPIWRDVRAYGYLNYYFLGEMYQKLGLPDKARAAFQHFLDYRVYLLLDASAYDVDDNYLYASFPMPDILRATNALASL